MFSTNLLCGGLPRNSFSRRQAFVDRKQVPRFAQGQPKGYFQMTELHSNYILTPIQLLPGLDEWEMRSSCPGDSLLPFGNW